MYLAFVIFFIVWFVIKQTKLILKLEVDVEPTSLNIK